MAAEVDVLPGDTSSTVLLDLDDGVMRQWMRLCSVDSLLSLAQTCRRFAGLCRDDIFWQDVCVAIGTNALVPSSLLFPTKNFLLSLIESIHVCQRVPYYNFGNMFDVCDLDRRNDAGSKEFFDCTQVAQSTEAFMTAAQAASSSWGFAQTHHILASHGMYSAATEVTNAFLSVATAPFDRQGRLWDHILDAASFDMQRGCVHEGLPTSETRSTGLDARAALNDVCELPRLLCWAALALDTCLSAAHAALGHRACLIPIAHGEGEQCATGPAALGDTLRALAQAHIDPERKGGATADDGDALHGPSGHAGLWPLGVLLAHNLGSALEKGPLASVVESRAGQGLLPRELAAVADDGAELLVGILQGALATLSLFTVWSIAALQGRTEAPSIVHDWAGDVPPAAIRHPARSSRHRVAERPPATPCRVPLCLVEPLHAAGTMRLEAFPTSMSGAWEGLISLPVAAWDPRYGLEGASAAEKDLKDAVRLPTGGELLRAPDVSDLVATLRSAAGGVGAGSPSAAHAAESAAAAKSPRPWLRDQAHVHLVVSPSGSAVGRGNTPLGTFHIKGSVQRPSESLQSLLWRDGDRRGCVHGLVTLRLEFDSYGSMAAATLEARDRARRAYILTGVVTVFGAMGSVTRTAWRAGACLEGSQSNSLVERLVVGGFKLWPQERK